MEKLNENANSIIIDLSYARFKNKIDLSNNKQPVEFIITNKSNFYLKEIKVKNTKVLKFMDLKMEDLDNSSIDTIQLFKITKKSLVYRIKSDDKDLLIKNDRSTKDEHCVLQKLESKKELECKSRVSFPKIFKLIGNNLILYYIEGRNFKELINSNEINNYSINDIENWFSLLYDFITKIHSFEILHCDIKLDNIILSENGKDLILIDWGLSISENGQYKLRGTPRYLIPELFSSYGYCKTFDCRTFDCRTFDCRTFDCKSDSKNVRENNCKTFDCKNDSKNFHKTFDYELFEKSDFWSLYMTFIYLVSNNQDIFINQKENNIWTKKFCEHRIENDTIFFKRLIEGLRSLSSF
jgi:serine/threonine protein kinase